MNPPKGPGKRDRLGAEKDCGRIFTSLAGYLDGDVDPRLCQELEALRAKCPDCVEAFLATLRRTVDLFRQLPLDALPKSEQTKLRHQILEGIDALRRGEGPPGEG